MKKKALIAILTAFLIFLIVCPLLSIFARAVISEDGSLDIIQAAETITEEGNLRMIGSSILLGILVVLVSSIIALPLAWFFSRTRFSRWKAFDIIFMIPFMTPPYIASMGWILFMQKRGLLTQLAPSLSFMTDAFFSLGGLVAVMSFHVFPFMMTMMKNAMLRIPSSLEEAGAVSGAGLLMRIRRILLPLLSGNYAIGALLVFVKTISEYGTPSTLGRRIGFDVFTTDIHRYAAVAPIEFGKSASLASVLVGICLLMWLIQNFITMRRSYSLVGGRNQRAGLTKLGKAGMAAGWGFIILVLSVSIVIPYFSIIASSLIDLRGYGLRAGNFTLHHYAELFTENDKGWSALMNSLFLSAVSATICALLGTLIVLAVRNAGKKAGRAIEAIGLIPEMLPSIVLVIGIMLFYNTIHRIIPAYNTIWMMVIAYVILFVPYTVQYVTSSFTQISPSLAAAGRVAGGTPFYVFRRITLPLIMRGIMTGWMMTFIIAFRELVTASLIAPPDTLVVSTYIVREFEQGSVALGMSMAVICVFLTTTSLILLNWAVDRGRGKAS